MLEHREQTATLAVLRQDRAFLMVPARSVA
jgi:hypothetical protein